MKIKDYLNLVANFNPNMQLKGTIGEENTIPCWQTKENNYYLCCKDDARIKFLAEHNVTEGLQPARPENTVVCIGFSPSEQKWYGWFHRAYHGFGIGSECKKGDCHYNASNKEDFMEQVHDFWKDENYYEYSKIDRDSITDEGFIIISKYNNKVPNEKLRGQINTNYYKFPEQYGRGYGRGEWTATTLEEAKEMAIDFAIGVN